MAANKEKPTDGNEDLLDSRSNADSVEEDDTITMHLSLPPYLLPFKTSLGFPSSPEILGRITKAFEGSVHLNSILGGISQWSPFYNDQPDWLCQALKVETDMAAELLKSGSSEEGRFGLRSLVEVQQGSPDSQTRDLVMANSRDFAVSQSCCGPLYILYLACEYFAHLAGIEETLHNRENWVGICRAMVSCHFFNIQISQERLDAAAAIRVYHCCISMVQKFMPRLEDVKDLAPDARENLLTVSIVFTLSHGRPRLCVRLQKFDTNTLEGATGGATGADAIKAVGAAGLSEESEEDEPLSISDNTRSRKSIQKQLVELTARVEVLERRLKPNPRPRSKSTNSRRSRSRSPNRKPGKPEKKLGRRNFMR